MEVRHGGAGSGRPSPLDYRKGSRELSVGRAHGFPAAAILEEEGLFLVVKKPQHPIKHCESNWAVLALSAALA